MLIVFISPNTNPPTLPPVTTGTRWKCQDVGKANKDLTLDELDKLDKLNMKFAGSERQ